MTIAAVSSDRRSSKRRPCPICGGAAQDPRGVEQRCIGFISSDGEYAHCSREEHANGIPLSEGSGTYGHRLRGQCLCGKTHGEAIEPERGRLVEVATYPYRDEQGEVLFEVVRFRDEATGGKTFRQRRPDGTWKLDGVRRVLYRLDELIEADPAQTVFVAEGEKDVETLRLLGLIATCNPQGAGKWAAIEACAHKVLRDRVVVVIADADDVGRKHAADVERSLAGVAANVRTIEMPGAKDVTAWVESGGTVERLQAIAASRRWITPLDSFLGDEEPDDDDREDWAIRDIVPRGEALLWAGPPKSGKTWAMLDLAIAVALGRPWLSHENCIGEPMRVLVLAFEDGQRRLVKRTWELARARGMTPNEPVLREHLVISREPLRLPGEEAAFAAELRAWKPSLVLIDNLTRVMEGDPNSTKDAARFGNMWTKLCGDSGAAVGFLHHTAKIGPLSFGDRNTGDPFELVKGNGDFVAVARHVVLMRPIDAPGERLSDVRMRGNLDLRREDFVLGFAREQVDGRWRAQLTDRGAGDEVRAQLAKDRKAKQEAERKSEQAAEFERRRTLALDLINRDGSCSTRTLAAALGLKSGNSVQNVFDVLVSSGACRRDGNRGYVFVDDEVRGGGAQ